MEDPTGDTDPSVVGTGVEEKLIRDEDPVGFGAGVESDVVVGSLALEVESPEVEGAGVGDPFGVDDDGASVRVSMTAANSMSPLE